MDGAGRVVRTSTSKFMKALLVASDPRNSRPLIEALEEQKVQIQSVAGENLFATSAAKGLLVLLFPQADGSDLPALVDICRRFSAVPNDRGSLLVAIARDAEQLNVLLDAGADDFLLWPADPMHLRRRLEICEVRIQRRVRDVLRSQHLVEAVRRAELGEQRFRHLAESSTEILTRCSRKGIRLYVSPACRQMLGYDPDQLLGTSIFAIVHPADVSVLTGLLEQLEQGANVATAVVRHRRNDGDFVWLELTCRSVRDNDTKNIEEVIMVARDVSALIHIDHDKLESAGQFEQFASRAPVGIFKIDNNGNCLFINPRACELLGTTPARALGMGWMSLVDIRDFATLAESSIQKVGDDKTYNWEMAIRHPNGGKTWLSVKATSTRDQSGVSTGYLATMLDVTREQRARKELLASEERFRSIVERITELVCRYLPDGTLTYVNEAYCRVFESSPESLVGTSFLPRLPEEDRQIFQTGVNSLSPLTPVSTTVHRVVLPSGEVRWQEWYDRGSFDDEGNLVEIVGTARDITERRTFEQELEDAGNFLRDVLDAVPDPITVEGSDGTYLMVNRSFAELVGLPREMITERLVTELRPDGGGTASARWPAVSDEQEITWPSATGDLRSLSEKRAVLEDRKGHHVLVSVMRDVTERKRYEAQMALTERLASLGTLAAGIAHEINNPLSYVIGNISFALDQLNQNRAALKELSQFNEVNNALGEAQEGAQRIAGIVRDVKVFSRADRDSLRRVKLESIVDAALRMMQSNIERKATVVRELADVPRVLANEARLTQVLVNLLVNALQALPERPVAENRIVVALRADARFVFLEVRDNGHGISEENLRRIFDPFFTTKAVGDGMGLGLSICNSIITAHGGRIDVESKVGVGSTFRIILPCSHTSNVKRSA